VAEPCRVFIAAGSNVRPRTHLRRALAALRERHADLAVSPAYASAAVGFEGDDFINLVVAFATDAPLPAVLDELRAVERLCGRPREAPKWGPRTMDLDMLLFGDEVGTFADAVLPRPDLLRRAYMLGPLADLAPGLVHPTARRTIGELWRDFDVSGAELRRVSLDDAD
jgi:2-amino-4-hydroxy-6-hydroxymethyldihydropteridine diphosphokinase